MPPPPQLRKSALLTVHQRVRVYARGLRNRSGMEFRPKGSGRVTGRRNWELHTVVLGSWRSPGTCTQPDGTPACTACTLNSHALWLNICIRKHECVRVKRQECRHAVSLLHVLFICTNVHARAPSKCKNICAFIGHTPFPRRQITSEIRADVRNTQDFSQRSIVLSTTKNECEKDECALLQGAAT